MMIEMGTRLGGNGVGELLGLVHGVDTTELAIESVAEPRCLDGVPGVPGGPDGLPYRYAAARSFHADRAGRLVALDGLDEARGLPGVVDVMAAAAPGDRVEPYTQCRAKAGFLLVVADDEPTLHARVDRALATIRVRYTPDDGDGRAHLTTSESGRTEDLTEELAG